ncbi:hypothetical protein [Sulfitobacter delicatus]|uniref:Uncharacterized protein n=1 Tax=Sulfitobacter delicatus TaxID=218672 RepID=A0A1G7HRS6_9RHOB|nr:hypothetical protein [Sulfitobacter delicatus]SDF03160.1 hypothetical protein SAMN04489759_101204 [Sulfitobacter delicatus]
MAKTQFYKRVKGPMDNYEDWYYLETKPDGSQEVLHDWSHVTPSLKTNSGSKSYTVEDFLAAEDVRVDAKTALREHLA